MNRKEFAELVIDLDADYLTNLKLSEKGFTLNQIRIVASKLTASTYTRRLDLSGNKFGKEAVIFLAEMLKTNTALRELDLSRTGIDDEKMSLLVQGLKANHNLEFLDLSFNYMSDIALMALADWLEQNTSLQRLALKRANLGGVSGIAVRRFCRAIGNHKGLKELYISGNNIQIWMLRFFYSNHNLRVRYTAESIEISDDDEIDLGSALALAISESQEHSQKLAEATEVEFHTPAPITISPTRPALTVVRNERQGDSFFLAVEEQLARINQGVSPLTQEDIYGLVVNSIRSWRPALLESFVVGEDLVKRIAKIKESDQQEAYSTVILALAHELGINIVILPLTAGYIGQPDVTHRASNTERSATLFICYVTELDIYLSIASMDTSSPQLTDIIWWIEAQGVVIPPELTAQAPETPEHMDAIAYSQSLLDAFIAGVIAAPVAAEPDPAEVQPPSPLEDFMGSVKDWLAGLPMSFSDGSLALPPHPGGGPEGGGGSGAVSAAEASGEPDAFPAAIVGEVAPKPENSTGFDTHSEAGL